LNIIECGGFIMGKTITLRVEDNIYDTLKRAADGDRRTISNFIEYAAINYIFNNNIVDDSEMNELVTFEKDIKAGIEDVKKGRYKIIG
jgi:predicted transcriptional regulator